MVKFFPLTFLLILAASCSKEIVFEDKLYSSMVGRYATDNVPLDQILDSLENQMIKEGILTGKGGQAKVDYYEKIVETGEAPYFENFALVERLVDPSMYLAITSETIDSLKIADPASFASSTYSNLSDKINTKFSDLGSITPITVSEEIIAVLDGADFDHPFYRAYMLLTSVITMDKESVYVRELPKRIPPEEPPAPEYGMTVSLSAEGLVEVDGKTMSVDDFNSVFNNFVAKTEPPIRICVDADRQTKYEMFAKIMDIIYTVHSKAMDKSAHQRFGKSLETLNKEERAKIERMHPWEIIEKTH